MSSNPFFSIITATHNRPDLLNKTLESVYKQEYSNWELIVIDDSTNDDTFLQFPTDKTPENVHYFKNPKNEGLAESRNRGLNHATGEWCFFLDDDDVLDSSQVLGFAHDYIKRVSTPWIAFPTTSKKGSLNTHKLDQVEYNWIHDFLYGKNIRGDLTHVMKRSFLADIRYHGAHRSEWQFWYSLALKSDFHLASDPLVRVEYLPDGMSNLGYAKKERTYNAQQFIFHLKKISTWKYLPRITVRYIASIAIFQKLLFRLKKKSFHHT